MDLSALAADARGRVRAGRRAVLGLAGPASRAPHIAPAGWEAAFAAVPRSAFLPEVIWPHVQKADTFATVDRRADPQAWQEAADSDLPIVTQWDDGGRSAGPGAEATSSASTPTLVACMLDALRAEPGMRVLEVGTGTGWNAALLSHRLGAENVTTVEVDPGVAATAEKALHRAGYQPRVVTGDGALGVPDAAPFDRLIVTCGMRSIPAEWIAQVRPGGLILLPWGTRFSTGREALAALTVHGDGTASGPFRQLVSFMRMRAQRTPHPAYPPNLPLTDTTTDAWPPAEPWHPFPFLAGLRLRHAAHAVQRHDDGHTHWLYDLAAPGWTAAVNRASTGPGIRVRRAGERDLWAEFTAAHTWWQRLGEPDLRRFGITATGTGEHPWFDSPQQPVPSLGHGQRVPPPAT